MQGGADGRAETNAGADVAGDRWSVEHDMKQRSADGVVVVVRCVAFNDVGEGAIVRASVVAVLRSLRCVAFNDVGEGAIVRASVVAVLHFFRSRLSLFALTTSLALIVVDGCTCGKGDDAGLPQRPLDELVRRRVPDCDLILALPKGWLVEMVDPGPQPAPPPPGTPIKLQTRTLLSARPGTPAPGMLVTPQLLVLEDPWLPIGTTGVDYLVAQRAANQEVIGTNIRHVDAEPSRREGRPSYHIRDEWTVNAAGAQREVSQEALLILDDAVMPGGGAGVHGYTVVLTLEKQEFATMQPLVREILASVHFEERSQPAATPPKP